MVAFESTIHDGIITLLGDTLLGDFGIDPVRKPPHIGANLAKLDSTRCIVANRLFEGLVEVAIVKENVGVIEPAIEVAFDGFD